VREIGDLISAWRRLPPGSEVVLATVVATSGSTYRRPGARMLLSMNSWLAGSISGGCLEGDVVQTAWERTANGPALVTYDATADEDIVWGFGLGCNGIVQVLMERLPTDGGVIAFLADCYQKRLPGVVATNVTEGPDLGCRQTFCGAGVPPANLPPIATHAKTLLGTRNSETKRFGDQTVLFEAVLPPHSLVIFGAGHDAVPLAEAAKFIGWHVTVVDWRPNYVNGARFPSADSVFVARPEETGTLALEPNCAAVVMTHNYLKDLEILRHLLPGSPAYVGLLGPRRRADRLLGDLALDERYLAKLHAPIGLDLGAEGPDEIALAIIGEIQAFLSGRKAGSLNGYTDPLHEESKRLVETASSESPICPLTNEPEA
jgi:xanthine dehydrogenase accessory factor